MNNQKLKMTYHPAKKEVLFERFGSSGNKIPIRKDSRLYRYMNQKGRFVLQDHGDKFFEDIARAFNGETSVDMDVVTTKSDFGDFEQMIEYYNEGHDVKINATLLAELPDMNSTYIKVKEHGEKAIAILTKHKEDFYTIYSETSVVNKIIKSFSQQVNDVSNLIRGKIECMGNNNINLCFAGVYSTGKSTLINAILGYKILPESINSETARMFKIQSPKKGEAVSIRFEIQGHFSELLWNENKNVFEFGDGPTENATRKDIQKTINDCSGKMQHSQMEEILRNLNCSKDVSSNITIYFPVPLDKENIQFTIYDTPGADSNYLEHQEVLKDALSEQTHSILVFVAAPNKLEGSGNNALLSYLKEAENKDGKTSIDIARSLFVINGIDTVKPSQRSSLKTAEIKHKKDENDSEATEELSIELANKKLFFTSATIGYAAKAKENGIADEDDEWFIEGKLNEISDERQGRYYKLNHVAVSECATKRLIDDCDAAMEEAIENNDDLSVLRIGSGVYALEKEISIYGEKYAGAVRAFAIIDSVDKALVMMNKEEKSLKEKNQDDINTVNQEIDQLRDSLEDGIVEAYKNYEIKDGKLPSEIMIELHLDNQYLIQNIRQPTLTFVDKLLKGWFFGSGKVTAKDSHKKDVKQKISEILADYSRTFLESRQKVLERVRNDFIEAIKISIRNNGNIRDEAKKYVCAIRKPKVREVTNLVEFGELYDSNKRTDKVLFWDRTYVNKKDFENDVLAKLTDITTKMASEFTTDYANEISRILDLVKNEFVSNIDKYSLKMQDLLADRKAMEELREKIKSAEKELEACQEELNSAIWSVNDNDE